MSTKAIRSGTSMRQTTVAEASVSFFGAVAIDDDAFEASSVAVSVVAVSAADDGEGAKSMATRGAGTDTESTDADGDRVRWR